MAVRRGTAAGRDVHVDEGVPAGRVLAGQQDRVGVADDAQVRERVVLVGPGDGQLPPRVVSRDRRAAVHRAAPVPVTSRMTVLRAVI
jgi:hypothetical protein